MGATSLSVRRIERSARGMPTSDGAGVRLTRVVGTPLLPRIDPFLMLDEFRNDNPADYIAGFPDHPHRGFETVTYMIAGRFRHRDNKGHEGLLESGGAQWMTAGRGIIHSEMPEQAEGLVWGFQLWLNLPSTDKMCEPGYKDIQPWDVPIAKLDGGVEVRILAGKIGDVAGPIEGRSTLPIYFDVTIPAESSTEIPVPSDRDGFIYPFDGPRVFAGPHDSERELARGELGILAKGDSVRLRAGEKRARVLVIAGKPLNEPIVQHGPFVMNTRAQIEQAVRDYQRGLF